MKNVRPIAIYLPQFHPIPENDEWWGKGFTEWTNVTAAKPRFRGHYQPHLPADLGFYDLRLGKVMEEQAELAQRYGFEGFCFYHYWFNGKLLLEKPLETMLASGKPAFPFMLAWANENWTRVWDGGEKEILLAQRYSDEDHAVHARYLLRFFNDARYIKIDGRPVFAIYMEGNIPNAKRAIGIYRAEAAKVGLDLYICRFDRASGNSDLLPQELGLDAAIEFSPISPNFARYRNTLAHKLNMYRNMPPNVLVSRLSRIISVKLFKRDPKFGSDVTLFDYSRFASYDLEHPPSDKYKVFPCVFPSWDNSARRKSAATIFINGGPSAFQQWTSDKLAQFTPYSAEENLFFCNAWNEWAEGNHLEPDRQYGHAYLQAFHNALTTTRDAPGDRETIK